MSRTITPVVLMFLASVLAAEGKLPASEPTPPIRTLLIDGQNNHQWRATTPLIRAALQAGGLCDVTVATSPEKGGDWSDFNPKFADYDVVVSNYNGQSWPRTVAQAFERFVAGGGGFVSVHAADNSFADWDAYNRMIGLGGWNGRDESNGPYVRWKEDLQRFTRDESSGSAGQHGRRVPFVVVARDRQHPITRGLPGSFRQVADELYGRLRGPAENMTVLATAYSDPATGGTGEHEPMLMVIDYGEGRVFHTTLGHDTDAMRGLAFQTTLRRGTQWAATGDVTLPPVSQAALSAEVAAEGDPSRADQIAGPVGPDTAAASGSSPPDLQAIDWIPLFDGVSLMGWTQKNGTASYQVEDGVIVGRTAVGSPNSFLCTDADYGDFELTFEVKVDTGLNSGVQIRSKTREDGGRVYGPQVEIEAAPGEAGYIYGEATGRGWITQPQPIRDAFVNDQYNRFRVRAVGDRIQTWIGERMIVDIADPESAREGFIGLQVHGIGKDSGPFEVRWRDVRIRLID